MKLTRAQFLELSALALVGCGTSEATSPGSTTSEGGAGGDGAGGEQNEDGAGSGGERNPVQPTEDGGTGGGGTPAADCADNPRQPNSPPSPTSPVSNAGSGGSSPGGSNGLGGATEPCEPPPDGVAGTGGTAPEPTDAGAAGSPPEAGGAPPQEDAGNPGQAGGPADASTGAGCAARAGADDFYGTEMVSMDALFDNHDEPHELVLSREQLDEALALEYLDEAGTPLYLRFDTTVGSGAARGLDPTAPHVHPVLFGRAEAEELLAQGSVETVNAPAADEGGIVHRHMLTIRLC